MVDADAAVAAAQKLADQFASQGAGDAEVKAENGEQASNKRKLEDEDEDASAMRKRASFNGPQDGEQVDLLRCWLSRGHPVFFWLR